MEEVLISLEGFRLPIFFQQSYLFKWIKTYASVFLIFLNPCSWSGVDLIPNLLSRDLAAFVASRNCDFLFLDFVAFLWSKVVVNS